MTIFRSPHPDISVPDISITELVLRGLDGRDDDPILTCGVTGRSLTGRALTDGIRRLAGGLLARGMGRGHVTAIMAPNLPEYALVFHGVAFAGGTLTTINPSYTPTELRHQLNDSAAEMLITVPDFLAAAREAVEGTAVREIVVIGEAAGATPLAALMAAPLDRQAPVDLARDILVLPYSSGTTGLPKGVMLSHRNLVANALQVAEVFEIRAGDTCLAILPFFHIYGMQLLMNLCLYRRASVVTLPRFDLETALRLIETHRMRTLFVVPPIVLALSKHPMVDQFDLTSLEWLNSGAAPLGAELSHACATRLRLIVRQGYGLTETSPATHLAPLDDPRPGSAGVLAPSTQARIVDPEGRNLPSGAEGELLVKGPQVTLGYLNNPEATARTIDPGGWLHTGDLGLIDADGYLYIVDRVKELIKVKGFQVAPAELEAVIVSHPEVADVAVVGAPDDEAGERPVAFVVRRAGSDLTEAGVIAFAATKLASYKHPSRVHFIDAVPKSPSGKILRRLLRGQV